MHISSFRFSGCRPALAAIALMGSPAASAPPPVDVTPLVIAADEALSRDLTTLLERLGTSGHFTGTMADPALVPRDCALDDPERERCFAEAARSSGVANLVFVIAEPSEAGARLSCVASDAARSRQMEVSLATAMSDDAQAALRERASLSGCLIGALHGPRR